MLVHAEDIDAIEAKHESSLRQERKARAPEQFEHLSRREAPHLARLHASVALIGDPTEREANATRAMCGA